MSTSPLHTGKMSNVFRSKFGAGNIATPLGSDISRTKFDFSGYDPHQMRKKKAPSPERKVAVREEDDMEIFETDHLNGKDPIDLNEMNEQQAEQAKSKV